MDVPAFTNSQFDVVQGEPFTLSITGCDAGCTISLISGAPDDFQTVEVLETNATSGDLDITLDGLSEGDYAFMIEDNETEGYNFSTQFSLEDASPEVGTATSTVTSIIEPTDAENTSSTSDPSSARTPTPSTVTSEIPTSTSLVPTSTSTRASNGSNESDGSDGSDDSNDGVSTAALVGIIVGCVLVFMLILAAAAFWWRRQKNKMATRKLAPANIDPSTDTAELDHPKDSTAQHTYGAGDSTYFVPRSELHGDPQAAELAGNASGPHPSMHEQVPELSARSQDPPCEMDEQPVAAELAERPFSTGSERYGEEGPNHMGLSTEEAALPPSQASAINQPRSPSASVILSATVPASLSHTLETASTTTLKESVADGTQDKNVLMHQYAQLEARRRRLMELDNIEEEQARLQRQIDGIAEK